MNVVISNLAGTASVTMPKTKSITPSGASEFKEVTTQSGKRVYEMKGFRPALTMSWEWVPDETIKNICAMLRTGVLFEVTYPDPNGTMTKVFQVSYPEPKIFKYKNGIPMWYDISLVMTAQEVE